VNSATGDIVGNRGLFGNDEFFGHSMLGLARVSSIENRSATMQQAAA
jgi:hypothetical protein